MFWFFSVKYISSLFQRVFLRQLCFLLPSPMHPFLQTLSPFKLGGITEEIALQVFDYYGIIGKKTANIICVCGSAMVVEKRG
jgi:hypothetical protein